MIWSEGLNGGRSATRAKAFISLGYSLVVSFVNGNMVTAVDQKVLESRLFKSSFELVKTWIKKLGIKLVRACLMNDDWLMNRCWYGPWISLSMPIQMYV